MNNSAIKEKKAIKDVLDKLTEAPLVDNQVAQIPAVPATEEEVNSAVAQAAAPQEVPTQDPVMPAEGVPMDVTPTDTSAPADPLTPPEPGMIPSGWIRPADLAAAIAQATGDVQAAQTAPDATVTEQPIVEPQAPVEEPVAETSNPANVTLTPEEMDMVESYRKYKEEKKASKSEIHSDLNTAATEFDDEEVKAVDKGLTAAATNVLDMLTEEEEDLLGSLVEPEDPEPLPEIEPLPDVDPMPVEDVEDDSAEVIKDAAEDAGFDLEDIADKIDNVEDFIDFLLGEDDEEEEEDVEEIPEDEILNDPELDAVKDDFNPPVDEDEEEDFEEAVDEDFYLNLFDDEGNLDIKEMVEGYDNPTILRSAKPMIDEPVVSDSEEDEHFDLSFGDGFVDDVDPELVDPHFGSDPYISKEYAQPKPGDNVVKAGIPQDVYIAGMKVNEPVRESTVIYPAGTQALRNSAIEDSEDIVREYEKRADERRRNILRFRENLKERRVQESGKPVRKPTPVKKDPSDRKFNEALNGISYAKDHSDDNSWSSNNFMSKFGERFSFKDLIDNNMLG